MNRIQILDCTLRDGGYVNNWNFGQKTISRIVKKLAEAQVDVIECGFLSEVEYDPDRTIFHSVAQITNIIPDTGRAKYVAMIALGEKEIAQEKVAEYDGGSFFGIRLTFHKHEIDRAFTYAEQLMKKNYQVFMQPVGTYGYTDRELLELIGRVNILAPYAFYIVDTLGNITGMELMRVYQLLDHNLDPRIRIGFHSHNNMQLSFANAQELVRIFTHRGIIIDASVFGMGRGAGNLCTELITQYLNENLGSFYDVTALLEIVDNYLIQMKEQFAWGYTIPYYIAAVHKCHPDYATYLMNKQTVNVKDIEKIIKRIPEHKRTVFDRDCIACAYNNYQANYIEDKDTVGHLEKIWAGKKILILAPGRSLSEEEETVRTYIKENQPYVISVNFFSRMYQEDMVFISNLKRFSNLEVGNMANWPQKVVITSNIQVDSVQGVFKVNYSSYVNSDSMVSDNAGLMLCHLLKACHVKKIAMAGFDGFEANIRRNYYSKELVNHVEADILEMKTRKVGEQIQRLRRDMEIVFITTSWYEKRLF